VTAEPRLRASTFNLLHGRSLIDGLVDADRLRDQVRSLDVDVVGLQEVDRDQPRSSGLDLTAVVAEALGASYYRFEPALIGTPGATWRAATDDDAGAGEPGYGVGLVSRYPVTAWKVVRLPASPVRAPVLLPGSRRMILLPDEPRVGLAAQLDTPLGPLTVATTHLSFVPVWNGVQLRTLTARLSTLPGPHLLLGDLNLPGRLPRWLSRWSSLVSEPTYPAPAPRIQLDHVLATPGLPHVAGVEVRELTLSDHRAIVVELGLGPPSVG
jgi:endonuclease/exonuclease/phosphatase family metal-dependent hydrolase